jgi:hypothetical protein
LEEVEVVEQGQAGAAVLAVIAVLWLANLLAVVPLLNQKFTLGEGLTPS